MRHSGPGGGSRNIVISFGALVALIVVIVIIYVLFF